MCLNGRRPNMLKDRKRKVEKISAENRRREQLVNDYGDFLGTLFASGDLFITFTLRDRHQDREASSSNPDKGECKKTRSGRKAKNASVSQPSKSHRIRASGIGNPIRDTAPHPVLRCVMLRCASSSTSY